MKKGGTISPPGWCKLKNSQTSDVVVPPPSLLHTRSRSPFVTKLCSPNYLVTFKANEHRKMTVGTCRHIFDLMSPGLN